MSVLFEALFPLWTLSFFLILCRIAAAVFTFPALGTEGTPRTVKVGLSIALAAVCFGSHGVLPSEHVQSLAEDADVFAFGLAVAGEVVFGSFLGYAFGLMLLPFRIAGSYLGQEIGLTIGNATDPNTFTSTNVVGQLFEILALILFFTLDMHHMLFAMIGASFDKAPIGLDLLGLPVHFLSESVAVAHQQGLLLVAPMAVVTFATVVLLSVLAKSSPQLNLFAIGLNVRIIIGLLVTLFFLPELLHLGERVFLQGGITLRQVLQI